jgi:hypothetical protein
MKFFYLSSKPTQHGLFEIHEKDCHDIPDAIDRDYLGPFNNGREALRQAVLIQPASVCCEKCCKSQFEASFIPSNKKED